MRDADEVRSGLRAHYEVENSPAMLLKLGELSLDSRELLREIRDALVKMDATLQRIPVRIAAPALPRSFVIEDDAEPQAKAAAMTDEQLAMALYDVHHVGYNTQTRWCDEGPADKNVWENMARRARELLAVKRPAWPGADREALQKAIMRNAEDGLERAHAYDAADAAIYYFKTLWGRGDG